MITDYEKWKKFLGKFKIEFNDTIKKQISIGAQTGDTVVGYSGFFVDIDFDENGKFLKMGIWE